MSADNDDQSSPVPRAANRLTIAHLLLWMTMTAVVLAAVADFLPLAAREAPLQVNGRRPVPTIERVLAFAAAPAYGAALAGVFVAIGNLTASRRTFPEQPGHWLLLMVSIVPLAVGAVWLLDVPPEHENGAMAVALIALALLAATAGTLVPEPKQWHVAFVMGSAGLTIVALKFVALANGGDEATLGLGYVFGGAAALAVACAAAQALIAAVVDWSAAESRDAFHWIGIGVFAIALAHGLAIFAIQADW